MSEHPLFVPCGEEHLAAVLTIPDSTPRAVVLFLHGWRSPRSQKNRVWTRAARELAARGIASVRMDHPGVGDSTGVVPTAHDVPVEQAMAVARTALRATGLSTFGILGSCGGARTGFSIAAREPSCVSLGSVLLDSPWVILRGKGRTVAGRAARAAARRSPWIHRLARRMLRGKRFQHRMRFVPDVTSSLLSTDVLFLYLGRNEDGRRLEDAVAQVRSSRGPDADRRAEVRTIPVIGTAGFKIPVAVQPAIIDTLVEWMDETLPGGADDRARIASPATVSASAREGGR